MATKFTAADGWRYDVRYSREEANAVALSTGVTPATLLSGESLQDFIDHPSRLIRAVWWGCETNGRRPVRYLFARQAYPAARSALAALCDAMLPHTDNADKATLIRLGKAIATGETRQLPADLADTVRDVRDRFPYFQPSACKTKATA